MKKRSGKRKWKSGEQPAQHYTRQLRRIPIKCRQCVWRSNGYIAFCERAKCIHIRNR